jgi:hypothetical protein
MLRRVAYEYIWGLNSKQLLDADMFNMCPPFYLGVFLYIACVEFCYFLNVRYLFVVNYCSAVIFVEFVVI